MEIVTRAFNDKNTYEIRGINCSSYNYQIVDIDQQQTEFVNNTIQRKNSISIWNYQRRLSKKIICLEIPDDIQIDKQIMH